MKNRQIINIINFIRGVEPREKVDLVKPVREQIALMKKYNLKGTFLIQYDALCNPEFTDMLRGLDEAQFETGVWFEVVQPMVEKAGMKWRGRFSWDWHSHCGFSVGYSLEEREKLVDILFEDFKGIFGYYPKSFGSWAFDAHTLDYANEKYGLDAACNCKEQWGTDGYNLWGGYYGQGYYPSRNNAFCPAQTQENQISVPVFRMLGSDPIHQYDSGLDINRTTGGLGVQGVFTLEPVYKTEAGGGIPEWVDWYFSQNYNGNCLTFAYSQAGQENSFGWESMKDGLVYQFGKISELISEGKLEAETLGETGRWYKSEFPLTPATTITALTDWKNENRCSVWFNCRNYRLNLYAEKGRFWIRDIYLFRENYRERYLPEEILRHGTVLCPMTDPAPVSPVIGHRTVPCLNYICTTNDMLYDNLPFVDGNRFSGNGRRSGLYPVTSLEDKPQGMKYTDMIYKEENGKAIIKFTGTPCGDITFILNETGFEVSKTGNEPLMLAYIYNDMASGLPEIRKISEKELELEFCEFQYNIKIDKGNFSQGIVIYPEEDKIIFRLD